MTVLRRGYVPVEPDTKGFDDKLREQFAKQDPGGKAGKQLGGQLNRALKRLNLDAIDIKADPKQALAKIDETERKLRGIADRSATVEIKVATQKALGELARFKKQLGDVGDSSGEDAATGFAARFGARLGPLFASVAGTPPVAAGGALIGAAVAPGVLAGIAGAVVGAAGVGGVVGGLVIAARNDKVKAAGTELGHFVLGDLEKRASGFVPATLAGIDRVRQGFIDLGPDLDRVFASSRFVEPLADGAVRGVKGFVSGFADAIDNADPVIDALSNSLDSIGHATGDLFSDLSEDAGAGASAIDDLTLAITNLITTTGGIIHAGAEISEYLGTIDKWVDQGRYWVEDNSNLGEALGAVGVQLDLTNDGFKVGTAEAEAYRKATLGTATAADFAVLAQAGMTDTQISATDASGRYRTELERVRAATLTTADASGLLVATADDVTGATKASTLAQQEYTRTLEQMAPGAGNAARLVDGLRKATDNLYGSQIAAADANQAYEASWDGLSESVKTNKRTLDIHTTAGRSNRDALKGLITSTNDLYYADINAGKSIAEATKKHQGRIAAVKEEARRVGLNKDATNKLIGTYGRIPPKKATQLVVDGVNKVVQALKDLYIFQRSLAEGIPVASMIAKLNGEKGPAKRYGGYHAGGYTGAGDKYEPAGVVHRDEYVIRKESRRKIEAASPGLLSEMNATGQVPGYAGGGFVAPVDTSRRWPFETDVHKTKILTRAQAASRVTPAFTAGDWPSSPGAQRGDSGVWRKVVALIKSTGPFSGSFGNAYRPGDPLWHGSGRAVDWMGYNQDRLATFLAARRPLELIHRSDERDYAYTRGKNKGSFRESLMNAHRNHVHIAMDDGGVRMLQPGMNLIPNGTGRPEPIAGPAAIADLAGKSGQVRLHPADLQELARILAAAVGAGNYAAGRRAGLYSRSG